MASSMRCKITGCDLDPCGVCRRCGDESKADHAWQEAEQKRDCYRREVCGGCGKEREQPAHDWDSVGGDLKCRRCGLAI